MCELPEAISEKIFGHVGHPVVQDLHHLEITLLQIYFLQFFKKEDGSP